MALHIVDGLPGAGKNVFIGKIIIDGIKRGYNIAANFPLKVPARLVTNMDELPELRNTILIIDEGQTYFDARNYQNMPREIIEVLRYNRKRKLEIYVIVQHYSRIDLNFRLLAFDFIRVHRIIGSLRNRRTGKYGKPWGLSIARTYYLEDLPTSPGEPTGEVRWTDLVFVRRKYTSDLYDTDFEIPFSRPWPWRHEERPCCPECGFTKGVMHV